MTIRFYDVGIEEMRDATQDDWNMLYDRAVSMHKDIVALQDLLEAHGIGVPAGMKRRTIPTAADVIGFGR